MNGIKVTKRNLFCEFIVPQKLGTFVVTRIGPWVTVDYCWIVYNERRNLEQTQHESKRGNHSTQLQR